MNLVRWEDINPNYNLMLNKKMEQYSIDLTCRLMTLIQVQVARGSSLSRAAPLLSLLLERQNLSLHKYFLFFLTLMVIVSSTAPPSVPEALAWPWKSCITSDNALVLIAFTLSGLMCWAVILDLTLVTMSLMSSMTLSAYFSLRYTRIYKLRPNNSRLDSGTSVCFNPGTTCLCFCPKPCLDK